MLEKDKGNSGGDKKKEERDMTEKDIRRDLRQNRFRWGHVLLLFVTP